MKRFSTPEQGTMGYELNGVKYISQKSSLDIYSIWLPRGNGNYFAGHIRARNHKQAVIKADEKSFNILAWNKEASI